MVTFVKFNCAYCGKEAEKTLSKFNQIKKQNRKMYCSFECSNALRTTKIEYNCANCGNVVSRTSGEIKKVKNIFCSHSCSAIYNNNEYKKKTLTSSCLTCGIDIKTGDNYCKNCKPSSHSIDLLSLQDLSMLSCYVKQSRIRDNSRNKYLASDKPKECLMCGYNKHFHVCHIKAVKDFDLITLISEVNHIDNLIALCPTHHWEFDNGYLRLEDMNYTPFKN